MDPTAPPPDQPTDPKPKPNPIPPPSPQPESGAPQPPSHSRVFAAQFQPSAGSQTAAVKGAPATADGELPSAFSLFQPSWVAVQRNLSSFIWLVVLPGLLLEIGSVLTQDFHKQYVNAGHILSLIGGLCSLIVFAAVPLLSLQSAKGKTANPGATLKKSWHFFLRLFGLYIVIAVVVLIGLLLLIVPGVIMIRRYFLAAYFLVDQDVGISEAMRQSAAATKGHSQAVFSIIGVQILLAIIGVIPVAGGILAIFFELPYSCAPALRYYELKQLAGKPASTAASAS